MKIAFTIVTPNYLAHAKTLGDSILLHNPDYVFYIGLIGECGQIGDITPFEKFKFIEIEELDDTRTTDMKQRYTPFELSCALKPYFAYSILQRNKDCERLKYFDSDILVFNEFNKTIENDKVSSIFLTPHYFKSIHPDEGIPNDTTLIKHGVYNAGFFEVSNSEESISFLIWWQNLLYKFCYFFHGTYPQVFVDQNFLDLVPIFFKNVTIIKDLGYNASFYNLHERTITQANSKFIINNSCPLIFFHYTQYRHFEHEKVASAYPRFNYQNTPVLRTICEIFRDMLLRNNVNAFYVVTESKPNDSKIVKINFLKKGLKKLVKYLRAI